MMPPKKVEVAKRELFETPLIGVSDNMERVRELILHVADTGLNVMICGESGVGKEVVARNLYNASPRCGKPFLKINCAALPEGLLESELFGHEQGAFTGAAHKKRGKFELANGGVLMLDEIGDMSLPLQAKMLHVLQSGEFSPLGAEKDVHSDAWIIAATNQALETAVEQGRFREDLYYRLNIIRIEITPLRERPEDIPPLVEHFIARYAPRFKQKTDLLPDARMIRRLTDYPWPGNVRELQNVLQRMLALGRWDEVLDELERRTPNGLSNGSPSTRRKTEGFGAPDYLNQLAALNGSAIPESFSLKSLKKQAVDQVERDVIAFVLQQTGWNRSKATRILKISYKTLLYKISELGLEPPAESGTDGS